PLNADGPRARKAAGPAPGRSRDRRLCCSWPLPRRRDQRRQAASGVLVTQCYLVGTVAQVDASGGGGTPLGRLPRPECDAGLDPLPAVEPPAPDVGAQLELP